MILPEGLQFVRMDTIPTTRMPVRRMGTTAHSGSRAAFLSALARGITGDMLDIGVEADTGATRAIGTAATTGEATLMGTSEATTGERMPVITATEVPFMAMPAADTAAAGTSTAAATANAPLS
jgi:hypothetical protein